MCLVDNDKQWLKKVNYFEFGWISFKYLAKNLDLLKNC